MAKSKLMCFEFFLFLLVFSACSSNLKNKEQQKDEVKKQMEKFAKALDFMEAAKLRDEMFRLEAQLAGMKKK
jgi:excinuclease ABC subunit B